MDSWIRTLMEHGDSRAMICLGDECASAGLDNEAEGWYRKAADSGDAVGMSRLAEFHRRGGDLSECAVWLEKAAEAGSADACFAWAAHLEETTGVQAATGWYRRAADLGEPRAVRRLSELEGGPVDDAPVARDVSSIDPGAITQTLVVSTVLVTFLTTLTKRLTDEGVDGAVRLIKNLAQRNKHPVEGRNVLIVIEDPDSDGNVSLNLWLDSSPEALAALKPELVRELAQPRRGQRWRRGKKRRRVFWSQERRRWEAFEDD